MWPFSRKPKTPKTPPRDIQAERIEQLARLFPTDIPVKYLGIPMEVRSHYTVRLGYPCSVHTYPRLQLRYVDNVGVVREVDLTYLEALALADRLGWMDAKVLTL